VLDDGGFATPHNRVGQRAYETGSSALALSFNSVSFDVCPGALKGAVRVSVDPWEAGVTLQGSAQTISGSGGVLSIDEVSQKDGLTYAIKGTFGINRPCETFYRSVDNPLSYFGTVFRRFAATLGISIAADPVAGSTPSTAHLLARQQSKPLSLVIEDMNHFSTNFIAEQILSAIGQSTTGNFDREVGLERMRAYAATLKIPAAECDFQDGSGLSHQNRLSAAAVTAILKHAASNAEYGIEFQKSLSVSKRNGTLRDRNFVPGALVRGKTGTLDGVSSLAGILRAKSGRSVVFAMLQNGPLGKDEASSAEERVVGELFRLL
jgi:D-alanyl-D-alanine carboxypeptidase/D-alanyl-D-alanine-endopeptidase (penicillin-binding protein 4)